MRFKANLVGSLTFQKLITSLSPLSKTAILKLTATTVHLICKSPGENIQVWSQIKMGSIFDMDSVHIESNANNELYLEIATEALAVALRSTKGAMESQLKLTKKGGGGGGNGATVARPYLTLTIKSVGGLTGRSVEIVQDVAVKVMRPLEMAAMKEPLCPTPEVSILLPPLENLKTVVDRLKNLSPIIILQANNVGEFQFKVESDEANVQTEWRGLSNPITTQYEEEEEEENESGVDKTKFYQVALDSKDLTKFLNAYTVATSTIACICENHCAIFYVYIRDNKIHSQGGVLTFFIPCITRGDD